MTITDVLVVGAGPVGLTLAVELRRRGIDCRIVDRLDRPAEVAKAVGIQPRTLEVWEASGLLEDALDASTVLRGQRIFVNGEQAAEMVLQLPAAVPYGFVALPQYETERLLAEQLRRLGEPVERGVELESFTQDGDGVTARLRGPGKAQEVRASFLVGCDGAHSAVRKGLAVEFEGDALPEEYMLADVEVDWDLPHDMAIRAMHTADGHVDDLLVCIPLPGHNRYRMSMFAAPGLSTQAPGPGEVAHGLEGDHRPQLADIQAVLDRLAPQSTTASRLRWSSVFRISHRIVDRYGEGRVLLAGDAAHIHPPTGAQGMNTGIQDAYNLGWKLALAVRGLASAELIDSYQAERHPVGEEVVGRTLRHARAGIEADPDDPQTVILREAQLLVDYPESPIVGEDVFEGRLQGGPGCGQRAPDCRGLRRAAVSFSVRLFELLRGGLHTLLLYAEDQKRADELAEVAGAAAKRAHGNLRAYMIVAQHSEPLDCDLPTLRDAAGEFRAAYDAENGCGYLIRPDGYVGYRAAEINSSNVTSHLDHTFAG